MGRHHRALPRRRGVIAKAALIAVLAGAGVPNVHAMTLAEAFEAALAFDPQYRAGVYELASVREGIPLARSALLPQVSLSYSKLGYNGTREFSNGQQQDVTTRLEYAAPQTTLSMRVPLFNYEAWSRLDQATAQTKGAEASQRARGLDLADRVTTAYLQTLEARALMSLSDAEVLALVEQTKRAEQRYQRGEGTRTDEFQARAALEVSRAKAEEARERVIVAAARLERYTGRMPAFVNNTPPDFQAAADEAGALRQWVAAGVLQNPAIEVRQAALEAARFGVKRNQAGHLPRVDLVANLAKSSNESLNSLGQSTSLRSVGVQVSLPIFSGFGVQAAVRQSQADVGRAEEELRNERENNALEIRRQLQTADSAALRALALRKAVAAGEVAVEGATRAQEAGLVTLSEVLDARRSLFSVRRDLSLTHYDHLAARVRMMVLAGEPVQRIIDKTNALLTDPLPIPNNDPTAAPR
jgi:outer membrane protein, protease secretion system